MNKIQKEIMKKDHWAIIEKVPLHHEGDNRSGYVRSYTAYETEHDLLEELKGMSDLSNITVIRAKAVIVTPSVSISLLNKGV